MKSNSFVICFDMEFTSLNKNADLISIGCISKNGDIFYGEITDYDSSKMSQFTRDCVIPNLFGTIDGMLNSRIGEFVDESNINGFVVGTFYEVHQAFKRWVECLYKYAASSTGDVNTIVFASDVGYYDDVLLIDLLTNKGDSTALPAYICPSIIDITGVMMTYEYVNVVTSTKKFPTIHIADYAPKSFDESREKIVTSAIETTMTAKEFKDSTVISTFKTLYENNIDMEESKHNALWDAIVLEMIYELYHYRFFQLLHNV